jgi:hypothetical protein
MITVALVGLACAATVVLVRRRERFARIGREHAGAFPVVTFADIIADDERRLLWGRRVSAWHQAMTKKYQHAAYYPWLPVEPDLPEPEP